MAVNDQCTHIFDFNRKIYAAEPLFCDFCEDYIWGGADAAFCGFRCEKCGVLVHQQCSMMPTIGQVRKRYNRSADDQLAHLTGNISLDDWTVDQTCLWLTVMNLHRYCPFFQKNRVTGRVLSDVRLFSDYYLKVRNISDSLHREAILTARDELLARHQDDPRYSCTLNVNLIQFEDDDEEEEKEEEANNDFCSNHKFIVTTFYRGGIKCKRCRKPVYGIVRQGLQCSECGVIAHRQCSRLGVGSCNTDKHSGAVPQLECRNIFCSDETALTLVDADTGLPLLLTKLCSYLEQTGQKRCAQTAELLVDAYRLSPGSSRINQLRCLLNDTNVETLDFQAISLTLCECGALVKCLLRESDQSLIPEELYPELMELFAERPSEVNLNFFRNSMSQRNFKTLQYFIEHLCTVWSVDYANHNMTEPEKLVDVFHTIVFRPPWHLTSKYYRNLSGHVMLMRHLMVGVEWDFLSPIREVATAKSMNSIDRLLQQRSAIAEDGWVDYVGLDESPDDNTLRDICFELYQSKQQKAKAVLELSAYQTECLNQQNLYEAYQAVLKLYVDQFNILVGNKDLNKDAREKSEKIIMERTGSIKDELKRLKDLVVQLENMVDIAKVNVSKEDESIVVNGARLRHCSETMLASRFSRMDLDDIVNSSFPYKTLDEIFVTACDRHMARQLLNNKPDGTFVLRPTSRADFALSVMFRGTVYDCMISKTGRDPSSSSSSPVSTVNKDDDELQTGAHSTAKNSGDGVRKPVAASAATVHAVFRLGHELSGFHRKDFESVVYLVNYFSNNSLSQFNSVIDTQLRESANVKNI